MLSLFRFFLKCFIHSRRIFWMILLGFVPVFSVLMIYVLKPVFFSGSSISRYFPSIAEWVYLHFLLPLMAVFIGTSVIIEEVESATLPYLLVRPIPRCQIVLAKLLASNVLLIFILSTSLLISFGLMSLDGGMKAVCGINDFLLAILVLCIGSFVYMSLFCMVGGIIRKPVLAGLFFTFGWEKMVGASSGSLRYATVIYYLNALFPFRESVSFPWESILVLIAFIIIFHFIAISLLSWNEYAHQEE